MEIAHGHSEAHAAQTPSNDVVCLSVFPLILYVIDFFKDR